jgi:hypothetical protein
MLIGGWLDGYHDSVVRMAEACPGPVEAILGPWAHDFPHSAGVGPRIEWRAEAVRFFDRWLKGEAVEDRPRVRAFVRAWHPPATDLAEARGTWTAFGSWPPPELEVLLLSLRREPSDDALAVPDDPTCGVEAGFWWGDPTPDQGPSDALSLVFDSDPLDEDVSVLGIPSVRLEVEADRPFHLFARICDVAPDGSSSLVSGGGIPVRGPGLDPGPLVVVVPLRATGWTFPAGHRIRVAVSTSLWPMIWPSPERADVRVHPASSWLELPRLRSLPAAPPFEPPSPRRAGPGVTSGGDAFPSNVVVSEDRTEVSWTARQHLDLGWSRQAFFEEMTYRPDVVTGTAETTVRVGDRELVWRGDLEIRGDPGTFHYRYVRTLREGGRVVRERTWEEAVPRDVP